MNRSIFGYGLWLVLAVSPALGSPLISIDEQYMLNTDAQRRIPILVSSPTHERVEGVNLAVQIGDGGAVNGGANTAPRIINLDLIGPGTIFNASNTGSTPQYVSLSGNPPYLIATADTTTITTVPPPPVPNDLEANGVLAWLTVNPAGATVGSAYQVKLQNVGANDVDGPWNTDFTTVSAAFSPIASIHIVNLHTTTWNAGNSGAWTDTTWTDPQPPFPNYTAQAIVNTSYTVNVASAQEANSLALSNGGQVAISSAGSLSLTTNATIANGSNLQVAGSLNAQDITLNGSLDVAAGGSAHVANISGTGTLVVGDGTAASILTADSINIGTLTLGIGSKIVIAPLPGGPQAGSNSLTVVSEPSSLMLLGVFAIGLLTYVWQKQH
jgi:hypothetical protein